MARSPHPSKKPVHNQHNGVGNLRIIGGEWRSRKLSFPDLPGLRPTPDRVRETLFNWLAPYVAGAKIIDLFAGSGAVFLEALSRGAASGLALDSSNVAISSLREHLGTLRCTVGQAQTADALRYLESQPATPFDLAFLDPPFNQNLLPAACALLEERGWLADNAWIYTESETAPSTLGLPGTWRLHREQKSGQVYYALWQRMADTAG
ncbi:16S rRNA (guanine(966)-N(2))-methyltransferase RsmD [Pseudomonas chlororaphis]|jgi:16S rRNA (guanine966-N2)-methyltransferase|uniref:Ribosomal RNA small subunit methyltransferase D n=1 Tax=Pseudomonas morbosilactucae TaxID=2938197 RepID=A0A9X1YVP6_9PSED|nr:16S rRNA (guanine(966)-N(2))-methyltransferase RsmD [Pseudomonas morbosilactucae]MCK9798554.1 16S rRNA (guanine(966)-N(2))-methyltransferase RsmD [Pseudomonas morbosilactucae]MCK9816056.1 16S rRNA (guanine(966)-N(2))-methyltransferase RsmD [Pseudomonas morbosilactucae]ROL73352.1 16S rRNA (guanine(966)-N(2))-methyltransferase RsmD [Pseudomonas chlororaphis]WEK09645.1 MAG: 16S rRNA (guanine(966)-N(2))-methyltransferase RsmD [Pseudomonas sp.]